MPVPARIPVPQDLETQQKGATWSIIPVNFPDLESINPQEPVPWPARRSIPFHFCPLAVHAHICMGSNPSFDQCSLSTGNIIQHPRAIGYRPFMKRVLSKHSQRSNFSPQQELAERTDIPVSTNLGFCGTSPWRLSKVWPFSIRVGRSSSPDRSLTTIKPQWRRSEYVPMPGLINGSTKIWAALQGYFVEVSTSFFSLSLPVLLANNDGTQLLDCPLTYGNGPARFCRWLHGAIHLILYDAEGPTCHIAESLCLYPLNLSMATFIWISCNRYRPFRANSSPAQLAKVIWPFDLLSGTTQDTELLD
ncbi:uncharacterized protein BDR25DRAFT_396962 [Lindgomyces ingoldianus]|uniref:Uncharacterized protein n=1 Tax=Lindgomyces ingoldianus TaxID=673940 RepID=A0ACB6QAG1_9PLEO|nr:uncharacterized protein BDR25DRAFT_396962 [Lindgomyces ingoldianus]KAF2463906.1 hypothetical protein BDR25DRAFT_396962 [Lindgomyces ingoldianus]